MKKTSIFLVILLWATHGLMAQTAQFTTVANSANSFTFYFIPSADFTSSGNLTFDVTIEIDNRPGCGSGLAAAPALAVSNIIYSNSISRSGAIGTSTSGGTRTTAGTTPDFWNQRYVFGSVSTAGTQFTGGQLYPLATFTLPASIPSVDCIKIIDWNNDRIGSGFTSGPLNGDTHISINGSPAAIGDNAAAIFVRSTTTNGHMIPQPTNSGSASGTSFLPLGWNEPPVANPVAYTIAQPKSGDIINLSSTPPTGSDPEDGNIVNGTIVITQLFDNGAELYYQGNLVTQGQEISNFVVSDFTVKLVGSGYTSISGRYAFRDSEGLLGQDAVYTISWAGALPVTLVTFDARKEGNTAQLAWATTQEANADRFEIQRSANAKTWTGIGTKAAAGNSKTLQQYTFTDNAPASGINYYRLKMIDKDQTFAYSRILNAEFDGSSVSVYPNPVSQKLMINEQDLSSIQSIAIVTTSGVKVYQANSVSSQGISVNNFADGLYVVNITLKGGAVHTHKIAVKK